MLTNKSSTSSDLLDRLHKCMQHIQHKAAGTV